MSTSSIHKTFSYSSPGHYSYNRASLKLSPFFMHPAGNFITAILSGGRAATRLALLLRNWEDGKKGRSPAGVQEILWVQEPLEIIFKEMFWLWRGWSKESSSKGTAIGEICTHQAGTRQGQVQKPGWAQRCTATAISIHSKGRTPL